MTVSNYVNFFRQTSPYIHAHRGKTFVIALGGDAVAHGNFHSTVYDIALLQSLGIRLVLVHGARPQVDDRLALSALETGFVGQSRITDQAAMLCVKQAVGSTRLDIESQLSTGLPNSPMHGAQIDVVGGNFITAKPAGICEGVDLQYMGEVRRIDVEAVERQLENQALVLMSPIGFSPTGEAFNLCYQHVAAQTAVALKAEKLILVSQSPGIFNDETLVRSLSLAEATARQTHCRDEHEKQLLSCACYACHQGVDRVHWLDCAQEGALLTELFTRDGCGTLIMQDHGEIIRPATIDDVGGILALIAPLEEQNLLVRRSRELLETEISRFTLVVHPEGLLLGCAALYPMADDTQGELACVATHGEFLGQGIASRLLQRIEQDAKLMGMHQLFVLTTQTAHWFREKGFVEAAVADLPEQKKSLYNYQRKSRVFSKAL